MEAGQPAERQGREQATRTLLDRLQTDDEFRDSLRDDPERTFHDLEGDMGFRLTEHGWRDVRAFDWSGGADEELGDQLLAIISNGSSWPPWSGD